MIRVVFAHVWLLLTLRHPMTGLPRSFGPWVAIAVCSALAAWLRWESLSMFFGMLIALGLLSQLSPRLAAAYALLSIGIDVVAWSSEMIYGGRIPYVFSAWEVAGLSVAAYRLRAASA